MMGRLYRRCAYLWIIASSIIMTSKPEGTERSFCCTTADCSPDVGTCESNANKSCYRLMVQVEKEVKMNRTGCLNSRLGDDVEHSLTVAVITSDLIYVAVSQCRPDRCNDETGVGGRWSDIGVNETCRFNVSRIVIQWSSDNHVVNNISDWCPRCESHPRPPNHNETLCQWYQDIASTVIATTAVSQKYDPNAIHLYISGGLVGAIVLAGLVFGAMEYFNVKKMKRAKAGAPKKKGAKERMLMTTLLPPPVKAKGTVAKESAQPTTPPTPSRTPPDAKASAKSAKEATLKSVPATSGTKAKSPKGTAPKKSQTK